MNFLARWRDRQVARAALEWERRIGADGVRMMCDARALYLLGSLTMILGAAVSILGQRFDNGLVGWTGATAGIALGVIIMIRAMVTLLGLSDQVLLRYRLSTNRWTVPVFKGNTARFDAWLKRNLDEVQPER
jgi:hypothetical protein